MIASATEKTVPAEGTLVKVDPKYWWSINQKDFHADGIAPRALFKLSKPVEQKSKTIWIVFHEAGYPTEKFAEELKREIGSKFYFELPSDFFDSNYESIDSYFLKKYRKIYNKSLERNPD